MTPDVHFSIYKLFQLDRYGVNLIEALSRDRYRFHVTAGVQLLKNDRQKAPTLSSRGYIELIFKAWERSKRPTYPPTWEGLFTVLRKMDLGHLVEQIAKCVTGSLPEIEDSPQTSEPEGPAGEKEKGCNIIMSVVFVFVACVQRYALSLCVYVYENFCFWFNLRCQ